MILFICSGNTCRSPMAEAIYEHKTGKDAESAGLGAVGGAPMSQHAKEALENMGIIGFSHEAQPVTDGLLERAEAIYCMGKTHKLVLCSARPQYADKIFLLDTDGEDVADPYGGYLETYEKCAAQIEKLIDKRFLN